MPTIAITGGIASGKTAFRQYLSAGWKAESFDADAAVADLVDHSEEIRQEVQSAFGATAYRENRLDRDRMRTLIFSDPSSRKKLENILHPRVRALWRQRAANCAKENGKLLVEIPLLYETGGEAFCDFIISVTCSVETQMRRIGFSRGIGSDMAQKIIASQMSLEERLSRADQVIWNDGSDEILKEQADLTTNYLVERYG
ncbi:MAG: dephospho-CoA kinase [Verrucomicrobia bacterium]|nr:MAG: dephospho-CoA kinase [Verrucomicrobiota bacterium]